MVFRMNKNICICCVVSLQLSPQSTTFAYHQVDTCHVSRVSILRVFRLQPRQREMGLRQARKRPTKCGNRNFLANIHVCCTLQCENTLRTRTAVSSMIHTSILGRRLASSFLFPDKLKICFSCLARNFCNCCSSLNRWRSHLQCRNGLMNHITSIISDCHTLHLPFPLFLLLLKLFMSFQQSLVGDVLSPRAVPRIQRVGTFDSP